MKTNITTAMHIERMWQMMHLVIFADSAFPVGGFSFSNTLESAIAEGVVRDEPSLEAYMRGLAWQAATTDSVASMAAWSAARCEDIDSVIEADTALLRSKPSNEMRTMLCRMGTQAADLAQHITQNRMIALWRKAIESGYTPGCYPTAQALLFAAAELDKRMLFVAQQYGVICQAAGAALRLMRITHFETQQIIYRAAREIDARYNEVCGMELEDIHSFFPEVEILSSIHEKGKSRMFMN